MLRILKLTKRKVRLEEQHSKLSIHSLVIGVIVPIFLSLGKQNDLYIFQDQEHSSVSLVSFLTKPLTNITCRFLNHFQSSSAMHKEMLAVLAAVTDVIKQNGGTESSTEYYAALVSNIS